MVYAPTTQAGQLRWSVPASIITFAKARCVTLAPEMENYTVAGHDMGNAKGCRVAGTEWPKSAAVQPHNRATHLQA